MTQPTGNQLAEFLTRCKNDPVFFAEKMLGIRLHAGQRKWIQNAHEPVNVLVPGNRYGKSWVIAVSHIWRCFTKKDWMPAQSNYQWKSAPYRTISVSMTADQAEIVFNYVRQMLEYPAIKPFVKRIYATPFPTVHFLNGASMTCRSAHENGKYIDGHSFRYVSIDEAGWIDDLRGLINSVILMRLAGGGQLDLLGTPKGISERGLYWYATRALNGVEGYYGQRGSSFENEFLPEEDMKRRAALLAQADPRLRDQAIYGAFVNMAGMAFSADQIARMVDRSLPAHQDYVPGRKYIQAWDLGRRADATVGVTFDVTRVPWVLVDYQRLVEIPWESQYELIRNKAKEYRVSAPRIDATGPQGDVIEEELVKRGIFVDPVKVSTGALKLNLINTLQTALDHNRQTLGMSVIPDEAGQPMEVPILETPEEGNWGLIRVPALAQLVDEFGMYQLDDKDLTQDSVMAVAMAVDLLYDGMMLPEALEGGLY
jgi:hypothetical protein